MNLEKIKKVTKTVWILAIILNPIGFIIIGGILVLLGGMFIPLDYSIGGSMVFYAFGVLTILLYALSVILYLLLKYKYKESLPNVKTLCILFIIALFLWIIALLYHFVL